MDITSMKIKDMRNALDKREITAGELADEYLKRIPVSGCFETVTEENAGIAAKNAQEAINSGKSSEICGIPLAISDNICTEDVRTSCGSKMLYNFIPPYSAEAADRLNKNGAVILGKTKIDEFSMGNNTLGAATAVKENLCAGAICSDTGGEIGTSASACGIAGLKPTYGRVSRHGLAAIASSMDTIGAIAKDVSGCASILGIIEGYDTKDVHTRAYKDNRETAKDIKTLKIAVMQDSTGPVAKSDSTEVEEASAFFSSNGAEVSACGIPSLKYAYPSFYIISSAEASTNLARYDGIKFGYRSEKGDSYAELVVNSRTEGFGDEVKKRILFGTFTLMSDNIKDYFYKAMAIRQKIRGELLSVFDKYDAFIFPARDSSYNAAASLAGLPVITVGGISIAGRQMEESTIIKAAEFFEKGRKV